MSGRVHLVLALIVGFAGGMLSRYLAPPQVLAQVHTPSPKEIRAQSFVVVDATGTVVGTFTAGNPQTPLGVGPAVVFVDASGHIIWRK